MELTIDSPYMTLADLGPTPSGKTHVYEIRSARCGDLLAHIRWFGRWRQYVCDPRPGTIFNEDCLRAIAKVLQDLRLERGRTLKAEG